MMTDAHSCIQEE